MFNPLIDNINDLNDMQVEEKVAELSKKYWQTRNPEVQMQIGTALNQFKEELYIRKQKEMICSIFVVCSTCTSLVAHLWYM